MVRRRSLRAALVAAATVLVSGGGRGRSRGRGRDGPPRRPGRRAQRPRSTGPRRPRAGPHAGRAARATPAGRHHRHADPGVDPGPGRRPGRGHRHQHRHRSLADGQRLRVHLRGADDDAGPAGQRRPGRRDRARSASGSPIRAPSTPSTRSSPASPSRSASRSTATCWRPPPRASTGSGCTRSATRGEGRDTRWPTAGRGPSCRSCPNRREGQEAISVVVPLRRTLTYADDGSLDDLDAWILTLGVGGRLRSLVELGATSGARTVSWAVDPALVDAVRQLAAGNPARSLERQPRGGRAGRRGRPPDPHRRRTRAATPTRSPPPSETSESPERRARSRTPPTAELPDDLDPETQEAADVAREWLGQLRNAMDEDDEVLAAPLRRHGRVRGRAPGPPRGLPAGPEPVRGSASRRGPADRAGGRTAQRLPQPRGGRASSSQDTHRPGQRPDVRRPAGGRERGRAPPGRDLQPAPPTAARRPGTHAVPSPCGSGSWPRPRCGSSSPPRLPLVVLLPYDWVPPPSSTFFSGPRPRVGRPHLRRGGDRRTCRRRSRLPTS